MTARSILSRTGTTPDALASHDRLDDLQAPVRAGGHPGVASESATHFARVARASIYVQSVTPSALASRPCGEQALAKSRRSAGVTSSLSQDLSLIHI